MQESRSAPRIEPRPIAESIRPNIVGPPFSTLCANTGSSPCKGAARNMKNIPMIVRRRVPGVVQTNFKPSRMSS